MSVGIAIRSSLRVLGCKSIMSPVAEYGRELAELSTVIAQLVISGDLEL
jgi:hypothetical protein